jgi:endonuclease/exonuclease/phosphatase family metal-dependent hydrolase
MHIVSRITLAATLVVGGGCLTPGLNYSNVAGPRYTGALDPVAPPVNATSEKRRDGVRLVTFNVKYGERIDSAIAVLRQTPELQAADVVALQEVDAEGTKRVADALGMGYVYYPATFHPKYDRDFGNAVLSRWPIVGDHKVLLPHVGRFRKTARIATVASVLVGGGGDTLRVYSAHLGTMVEISPRAKREQAATLLADAARFPLVAILGDMNSYGIGRAFRDAGFAWATEHNPRTFAIGRWDHVFLKGVALSHDDATGVVTAVRGASDHRPVWALIAPAPPAPPASPAP